MFVGTAPETANCTGNAKIRRDGTVKRRLQSDRGWWRKGKMTINVVEEKDAKP